MTSRASEISPFEYGLEVTLPRQNTLESFISYVIPDFDYENDTPSLTDIDGLVFDLESVTNFETS